ncbi:MAG: precorrin-8X methylmutase, partial [Oscillospiraceae bacterium]|nr:precorrin-8X methylmutase [Oscillospiraceae bacterium]
MKPEHVLPKDIERRSFEIIRSELARPLDPKLAPIVMRVIHTTADFEYADSLYFSDDALEAAETAFRNGVTVVTDTTMAMAGINKPALAKLNSSASCYIADADVAELAAANGTTRASAAVDKAARLDGKPILAIGNAPTALIRICELVKSGELSPALV